MDGNHMSAIVTVPSPLLILQNHFSSLEGLETTYVGGDPYIGTSIAIVEFNYVHITVENHIGSKIWIDPNEMEKDASDTGKEIVRTKRKPRRPPKGTGKASSNHNVTMKVLVRNCSDHSPILASLASNSLKKVSNFRFFSMWLQDSSCLKLIYDSWNNKGLLLGIQQNLETARMSDIDGLLYQEKIAKEELNHALHCQYLFWKEIAKMFWFKYGDRNTTFFHVVVKRRNNSSGIHHLRIYNVVIEDPKIFEKHILDFYKTLYAESISHDPDTSNMKDFIGTYVPNLVSSEENMMLMKCPDFLEIKNVVFNLNGNSAPGPDGFGGVFYHSCWDIIGTNGRKIHDCIGIASEAINMLSKKVRGEEVLSRGLSKLMNDKKILHMASPQGQYVNNSKSSFFTMDYSARFVTKIQRILSCSHDCLPFNYLGVPIFVVAPKICFLQPLADKVKLKLASWKGKSLSMMGQIQLVNTMITGILAYSFNLYKWLVYLLKQVEQWCRNFIWTGDILKKGIATVNWDMICSPLENGGLSDGISIPDTVSQYWTSRYWNILLSLQQMPHLFSHIMVRADQDVPN
ncbi:uncharacterized protein [Phaseolus vulgaris]|uniref:uncharacterized protein n=1 Tax=Phaseolus vulgaris TaxID=3885 RepID=UPI0035CA5E05